MRNNYCNNYKYTEITEMTSSRSSPFLSFCYLFHGLFIDPMIRPVGFLLVLFIPHPYKVGLVWGRDEKLIYQRVFISNFSVASLIPWENQLTKFERSFCTKYNTVMVIKANLFSTIIFTEEDAFQIYNGRKLKSFKIKCSHFFDKWKIFKLIC